MPRTGWELEHGNGSRKRLRRDGERLRNAPLLVVERDEHGVGPANAETADSCRC